MNISYLRNRYKEAFIVAPNDLGNPLLTRLYKNSTRFLKVMPFMYIVPLSICIAVALYVIFGLSVIRLASLLQNGF